MRQDASLEQDYALACCKGLIEQQLGWGNSAGWTSKDFEELSVRIQDKTGRAISETTLKRLWGRVTYNSRPSRYSLTTLAVFLGYPSWRAFNTSLDEKGLPNKPTSPREKLASTAGRRIPRGMVYVFSSVGLVGFVAVLWLGMTSSPDEEPALTVPASVLFRSRPVAKDLPNTVIFEYDVRGVTADSFFIQQSWDQRRRALVSPQSQTFTAIYYHPGFFNAKLIANDSVLKEHPVHVTTEGWLALIEEHPIPIYLRDAAQRSEGSLSVSREQLQQYGYDAGTPHQPIRFYNVRTFGSLHTDSFSLETAVRHDVDDGRYPCQRTEIVVIGEHGALMIPLGIPGCVSDMQLMLSDVFLSGSTHDLSAFGADLSTWQRVVCDVSARAVRIQVGTNTPYTTHFKKDIGKVVGLRFGFEGSGAVDYVVLKDSEGHPVYEEAF